MAAASTTEAKLANAKVMLSAAASLAASLMVARSVVQNFLPSELEQYFYGGIRKLLNRFSSELTMVIDEMNGCDSNQIYEAAEIYLATKISPTTRRLNVSKLEKEDNIVTTIDSDEPIIDTFNGVKLRWVFYRSEEEKEVISNNSNRRRHQSYHLVTRSFELGFHKKHREMVIKSYLPFVVQQAKQLKQEAKTLKIFTLDYQNMYGSISDLWMPTNLDHPATFDKLAMDSDTKDFILGDLERFLKRKDYYKKIGKAWKRGYLLYGPPGTGKSSLIASMANYLKFDVYDLELTAVESNSDLRKVILGIANRSILVVEDIDCTVDFEDRKKKAESLSSEILERNENQVTLSGFLNFIDGLWSCCGDERIIIFTTNHKEKLDPALLRPGRMDVHVLMSYCTPCGFKVLASNYLGIKEHPLFSEIEELILTAKVTPAEVAEQLLKGDDADGALKELIKFMKVKEIENQETEAKILQGELEAKEKKEKKEKEGEEGKKASEID